MKLSLPEFALQAGGRPAADAPGVEPMRNPYAEQTARLGGAVADIGDQLSRQNDVATATEADNKLADATREILRSPNGYLNLVGRDARDKRQSTLEALDQAQQRVLDTLTPTQRDYVNRSARTRYQAARATIDGHYADQVRVYEIGQTEARATSLLQEAHEAFFAPGDLRVPRTDGQEPKQPVRPGEVAAASASYFETTRDGAFRELRTLAQLRGMSPEQTEQVVGKARESLYGAIVDQLAGEGQALRAADFLGQHGGDLAPAARAKIAGTIRTAGVKEQGQRVASWLSAEAGSLTGRLAKLRALAEQGAITTEIADEAERRFLHFETVRREERQRSDNTGLAAAQEWSQLHPGEALPRELAEGLGANAPTFALWKLRGGASVDTQRGLVMAAAETESSLTRFKTPDELVSYYTKIGVGTDTLRGLVSAYTKSREKSTADATKAPSREDVRQAVLARLSQRGVLQSPLGVDKFRGADNHITERTASIVDAAMRALPANGTTQEQVDAALRTVFDLNAVTVGGHVYPAAWLTNAEFGTRTATATKSGAQTPVTELFAQGPGDLRNIDRTTAKTAGGKLVDFRPAATSDQVMNREEATAAWLNAYPDRGEPTEADLAEFQAQAVEARAERRADAERAATLEGKLEADAILRALHDEVEKATVEHLARLRADVRQWWSDTQDNPRGLRSMIHGPAPEEPTVGEAYRLAVTEVLGRHQTVLHAAGVSSSEAMSWLRPTEDHPAMRAPSILDTPGMMATPVPAWGRQEIPYEIAPSPAEVAELKALREKYKKTE